ncbi:MAG: glycosyltransferase [Spirochaeta sp.]|jgi:glycosyltransferase involved in cell wall biosynthesis|nr:glycosyltransferase [Spirochaeta sp.]
MRNNKRPAPDVAVVIPVRNMETTVKQAAESILQQTYRRIHLIVVDDGSTDSTPDILERIRTGAPGAVTVLTTGAHGLVPALNAGIAAIATAAPTARYIARMDADDVSAPQRLERQVDFLETHHDIGVCGTQATMPDTGSNAGYRRYTAWVNARIHPRQIRRARFIESPLIHPTVMFRRTLIDRFGGYRDGPFPEDYELWLRWFEQGVRAATIPERLLTWNDYPERFSRQPGPQQRQEAFFTMKSEYLARYVRDVAGDRDIVLWGAGRRTRRRMEPFDRSLRESRRAGVRSLIGITGETATWINASRLPVLSPNALPGPATVYVVSAVANHGARPAIAQFLARRGFRYERDWIAAA